MRTFRWVFFLAFIVACAPAGSAPLTSGADFLSMTVGARPDGMGQAYSAIADDIYTLSFNPAGLASIQQAEFGYGREEFVFNIHYYFLGLALPTGDAGVFSLGYIDLGTDPFNSTADPTTPTVSDMDMAFTGAWGGSIPGFGPGEVIQLGGAIKYINRQLAGVSGTGFGFDLGLRYIPRPRLAFSASLLNIGSI